MAYFFRERLLLLFLFISNVLYGQSFLPATLITQKHDTLLGYVRADYSYDFIRFKGKVGESPVNQEISVINKLIINDLVYVSKVIDGQAVLLQQLVSGKAELFIQRRKPWSKDRFFLAKDTVFVELVRKISETTKNSQLYSETYQNHLSLFSKILNDCNDFTNQKWPTGFDEKSFTDLVTAYNTCSQTANSKLSKNSIYPASKKFPIRWFVNAGTGILSTLPAHTKASVKHYTTHREDPLLGGYINLNDQGSSVQVNNFITANLGFERTKSGTTTSWGGLVGFSQINYTYHLNSQGFINYYPNDFSFVDPAGVLHDYLPPPLNEQPMQFDGESQEKAFVIQANLFVRRYWVQDKSRIYLGTGAGYGLRSSTYAAPVSIYLSGGRYQGIAVRDAKSASYSQTDFDFLVQAGYDFFIRNSQTIGFSFQYNSFYANRVALALNYSF